ncbi:LysR family transcriptional regulator [Bacillus ndiopicus]|uniref:LysR family transcriptional regulator n=1 Tax=Bacillus ndiopicus TaxID=1347368 RepID=UPI0005AB889B|nr:LysR family transcriptional regulator [Bacillus ndiopicus]
MDIRQLRYFIAIVEEQKISAAAERLHISQPPLSQHLKAMEQELDAKLIERNGRFFEVTEAGKTLYKYALQMTQLMEEAQAEVKEIGNGGSGILKIGVNTLSVSKLSDVLQQFKQLYPNVTYKIQQNESAYLCRLVRERHVELAFIRLPLELEDFSVVHLYTEPFYFITSQKQFPLHEEISLIDIQQESLILPSTEGLGLHYLIWEAFSRQQIQPNIISECSDITLLLKLVEANFGTAIVPESVLKQHHLNNIYTYKIDSSSLASSVGLIWLKNHYLSKTAQNFVELFKKQGLQ